MKGRDGYGFRIEACKQVMLFMDADLLTLGKEIAIERVDQHFAR
jgi:hypothetical protein